MLGGCGGSPRPLRNVTDRPRQVRNDEATTELANNPQKTQVPTEAALSAIQEALNIRPAGAAPQAAAPAEEAAEAMPDLFKPEAEAARGLRAPANDDRKQVGLILQALRRRPSRIPYI